jgi:hypothetical protein
LPAVADKLRSRAVLAAAAVLALAVFQLVGGFRLLSPGAGAWKGADGAIALSVAGAEALFRGDWTFPLGATWTLARPDEPTFAAAVSATLVHTPVWPALIAKALHALGAPQIDALGLTLLLASLAQPLSAIALLWAAGVQRLAWLAAGAALALLMPGWLWSLGQPWLAPQALVLFALALSFGAAREGLTERRILGFAALGVLAPGFDAAFLVAIGGALAAAIAAEILQGRATAGRIVSALVRFAAAAGGAAFVIGWGQGQALAFEGFGTTPAAIPWGPLLAGAGAGVLLLALAAAFIGRRALPNPDWNRRYGPVVAVFAALAAWGLVTRQLVLTAGADGLLLAGGFAGLARLPDERRKAFLVAIALLLQLANAGPAADGARRALRAAAPPAYPTALDTGVADQRAFIVVPACAPPDASAKSRFASLALLAVRHGGNIAILDSCRLTSALASGLTHESGPGDPRLTYLMPGAQRPPARTDCASMPGGAWLCGRGMALLAAGRPAEAAQALEPGYAVTLPVADGRLDLGGGWSPVEGDHSWSNAVRSTFAFIPPRLPPNGLDLTFQLHGFVPPVPGAPPQTVEVRSNVAWLATWQADGPVRRYKVHIPSALLQPGRRGWITFFMPGALPGDAAMVHDSRALGVDLRSLTVAPAP